MSGEQTTVSAATAFEADTLRQQVSALPAPVLAAWRIRYVSSEAMDLEAAQPRAASRQPTRPAA